MHVVIVEDDELMAATIARGVSEDGYSVVTCGTVPEALKRMEETPPDLILLDLGLPGPSGLEVLRHLRAKQSQTPVIILTARDAVRDRVKGLDAGADDYLIKPFAFAELLARIRARLRRPEPSHTTLLRVGGLCLDVVKRKVTRDDTEIVLTGQEFELLHYLVLNAGKTVSRDMIARDVWRIESRATPLDNVIDVHISHLRAKVDRGYDSELIKTVWGVGFALKGDA